MIPAVSMIPPGAWVSSSRLTRSATIERSDGSSATTGRCERVVGRPTRRVMDVRRPRPRSAAASAVSSGYP